MREVSTPNHSTTINAQGDHLSAPLRAYYQAKIRSTYRQPDPIHSGIAPLRRPAPEFSMEHFGSSTNNYGQDQSSNDYRTVFNKQHTSKSNFSSTAASNDPYHPAFLSPSSLQTFELPSPIHTTSLSIDPTPLASSPEFSRLERSYLVPEVIAFLPEYPMFLSPKIPEFQFQAIISEINLCYKESHEKPRRDFFDFILDSLTCYTYRLCCGKLLSSPSDMAVKKASSAIAEFNTKIFNPAGLTMIDPINNAFLY